jgi:hypothetical protein
MAGSSFAPVSPALELNHRRAACFPNLRPSCSA